MIKTRPFYTKLHSSTTISSHRFKVRLYSVYSFFSLPFLSYSFPPSFPFLTLFSRLLFHPPFRSSPWGRGGRFLVEGDPREVALPLILVSEVSGRRHQPRLNRDLVILRTGNGPNRDLLASTDPVHQGGKISPLFNMSSRHSGKQTPPLPLSGLTSFTKEVPMCGP